MVSVPVDGTAAQGVFFFAGLPWQLNAALVSFKAQHEINYPDNLKLNK